MDDENKVPEVAEPVIGRPVYETVDAVTRARVGSLAAHGLLERQICEVLLLTMEQVISCKESMEYKNKYAEVANELIQRQIDLTEGWDAVEEKAVAQVLETLEYSRDPKYALLAAKTANAAQRRSRAETPKVIDGRQVNNSVIVLNLNRTFIKSTEGPAGNAAILDITPKLIENQQQRRIDLPSPQAVENLLAPVMKEGVKDKLLTELEKALDDSGISSIEFGDEE